MKLLVGKRSAVTGILLILVIWQTADAVKADYVVDVAGKRTSTNSIGQFIQRFWHHPAGKACVFIGGAAVLLGAGLFGWHLMSKNDTSSGLAGDSTAGTGNETSPKPLKQNERWEQLPESEKIAVIAKGVPPYALGKIKNSDGKVLSIGHNIHDQDDIWKQLPGMQLMEELVRQGFAVKTQKGSHQFFSTDKTAKQLPEAITIPACPRLGSGNIKIVGLDKVNPQIFIDKSMLTAEQFRSLSQHMKFRSGEKFVPDDTYSPNIPNDDISALSGVIQDVRGCLGENDAPMHWLAAGACHVQDGHFFSKADKDGNYVPKYANGDATVDLNDPKNRITFISITGVDFLRSSNGQKLFFNDKQKDSSNKQGKVAAMRDFSTNPKHKAFIKKCMSSMWKTAFHAANSRGCKAICIPPIGMRVFLGSLNPVQAKDICEMYIETLGEAVAKNPQVETYFCCPKNFNGGMITPKCEALAKQDKHFHLENKDSNLFADELSSKGIHAGAVVAADPATIFGVCDFGMRVCERPSSTSEENTRAHSSFGLASKGLHPEVWDKPVEI